MRRLLILALAVSCAPAETILAPNIENAPTDPTLGEFLLREVNVVDVVNGRIVAGQTVLLRDGRIEAMGPDGSIVAPTARPIVASGHYLMPGLIDMHVHMRSAEVERYVVHGITAVRNMWGYSTLPALIGRITSRELRGPLIYSASPGLDAPPARWPETRLITDSAAAEIAVNEFAAAGWKFIKVYDRLSPDVYRVIQRRAGTLGIRVVGHVPFAMTLEQALALGQASVEHLIGYERGLGGWAALTASGLPARIQATRAAGTWNCPTLAILTRLSDGVGNETQIIANRRRVARDLYQAGARLLIGTDAGIDVTSAGASILEELEEFRTVGVTIPHILRIATHDAAEFLGALDSLGTVTMGKRADLVLLDANPLESLAALRDPVAVVLGGEWLPRAWLRTAR